MAVDAQFLIQAGHEGGFRNSGTGKTASAGTAGEQELTPIVANDAAARLKAAGYTVIRENAYYNKKYNVDLAVAVHFDGSGTPCASGASVGYPAGVPAGSNKPAVDTWKSIYTEYFPFKWMPDNFTAALRGYYGYAWTSTNIAEFLIEFGELTCPEQKAWLVKNTKNGMLGWILAYALERIYCAKNGLTPKIAKPVFEVPAPPAPPTADLSEVWAAIKSLQSEVAVLKTTSNAAITGLDAKVDGVAARLNKLRSI